MELTGVVTSVGKYTTGTSAHGPWTVQRTTVKVNDKQNTVVVWNRPAVDALKGRVVKFTELKEVQDRDGKPELRVTPDSQIAAVQKEAAAPFGGSMPSSFPAIPPPSARTIPTQAEFDAIIVHAAGVAAKALKQLNLTDSPAAVAEIVKGYMVAFVKNDFSTPPMEPPFPPPRVFSDDTDGIADENGEVPF